MIEHIDPSRVRAAFMDSLFRTAEVPSNIVPVNRLPAGAVVAHGVVCSVAFHPGRLRSHEGDVRAWLRLLPRGFHKDTGGGWSFLNACQEQSGQQWTDLHQVVDELFLLGIGLGYVSFCIPREYWSSLPGGMPYVVIDLK